ncbi:hypothetical protein GUJ93_ZPchr0014g46685 [Zizania palustris]|uniref:Uncharacterized protein n=1 Tax=Zizania palustris TaxID=103762 RepID=A0A8J5SWF1_ZIZPA|nr:hypothetical protein GUJ93_ZPchr0014g46685 [Zizania palustris]
MTTTIPSAELAQAIAELKQVVDGGVEVRLTNIEAWMGLAPVASTLPSWPYYVTGFLTVPSPSPVAKAEAQEERKDQEALNPILIKKGPHVQTVVAAEMAIGDTDRAPPTAKAQSLVESFCVVTSVTSEEAAFFLKNHNGALDSVVRSYDSTDGDMADPTP